MIYVIAEKDDMSAVKIGFTETGRRVHKEPALKRLSGLQVGTWRDLVLVAYCDGTRRDERSIHRRFSEQRIRGEWFRNHGALSAWLDGIRLQSPLVSPPRGSWRQPESNGGIRVVSSLPRGFVKVIASVGCESET
jgi:hypothetical protein